VIDKSRNTASSLANRFYRTETSALWKFNKLVILKPRYHMEMNLSGAPMETSMRAADRAKTVRMSLVARDPCLEDHLPGVFPVVLEDVDSRTAGRGFHGGREPRQLREELAGVFRRASTVSTNPS
jgi:hypothetical protein